ncbi:MAG: type I-U CRISPR-associated protein Cas5/Cas6, partial [Acidobacteriaceae bacterium]|nr:type I-U CRISPR-associated protein Cas5/Cas6 [Acidobacteriaceae bacterium]
RVIYLTGRVYAASFEDGDEKRSVEWPPHPGRLFQALVAAWGETGKDDAQESFLTWLEGRTPPSILFDMRRDDRENVTTYVPVNDCNEQFHGNKGTLFQTLSETVELRRDRKARRFPSFTPLRPDVDFRWEAALPIEHRPAAESLLRNVTCLGHSSTLVSVELASPPPNPQTVLRPDPNGSRRLRVPAPGRLKRLEVQFERFQQNPVKTNRPDAGPSALYGFPDDGSERPARAVFSEMLILRRIYGDRFSLCSTLLLTAAFRGAVMKFFGDDSAPEFISGHASGSTRNKPIRSEQPHLAFVPIADVGHDHARGHLMGIAALVPKGA